VTNADAAIAAAGRERGRIQLRIGPADPDFLKAWRAALRTLRLPALRSWRYELVCSDDGEGVDADVVDERLGALGVVPESEGQRGLFGRGSRKARFVPVPAWLMEIVATSLPLRGRLFPTVTANGLRSAMSDLCESIGLTHCTPHRLRHRRISLWHVQGVPARELADRAGHSKPSMSLDVYSHAIVPDEVDPEALKMLLSGGIGSQTAAAVMHRWVHRRGR
jgi:hypothetical protein